MHFLPYIYGLSNIFIKNTIYRKCQIMIIPYIVKKYFKKFLQGQKSELGLHNFPKYIL